MDVESIPPLVKAEWLAAHLHNRSLCVVDATVHLPDTGRNAKAEYLAAHIPGALFFDLEDIADPGNPLPRKIPPRDRFVERVAALGIGNDTHVIAYDTPGLYSAARVWWLFRQFGHDKVSILDGGLVAWHAAGLPTNAGEERRPPAQFTPTGQRDLVTYWPDVLHTVQNRDRQILDARTPGRFAGTEVDRYPGARPGHIPHSLNLYWARLLDPKTRELLPVDVLRQRFADAGLSPQQPTTLTCGSGLTACILALGLHLSGNDNWKVYDGSWDEWGRRADLPVDRQTAP
ncbi:MAG: sulfurtransferase [Burkholderiales bacterium]|nr:sulfurtransferase [Burkholderiales bacterium]